MPQTFCLLNHTLTQNQISELEVKFHSEKIVYPSEELAQKWAQIPPEESNDDIIFDVVEWLKENAVAGDLFVVQGEFGSTFAVVDYALKNALVPLYATTKRVAKEMRSGEEVHREYIFEHVCFKKYRYFETVIQKS